MEPRQILNDCRQLEILEAAAKEQAKLGPMGYRMSRLSEVATVIEQAVYDAFIRGFRQGVKQCCDVSTAPSVDISSAKPDK